MNLLAKRGLSLERLQGLLDFAAAGSLIKAAKDDPVRQSLLSRQLRELEEFFGVEITARRGRGLVFTEPGQRLVALVREQFRSLQDFRSACEQAPVRISLASARTIISYVVVPKLRPGLVPGVAFDLVHEFSADSAQAVADGRHDLCIVDRMPLPRTLAKRALGTVGYSLYLPRSLAGKGRLSLKKALATLPLALPAAGRIRELLNDHLGSNAEQVAGMPGFDLCRSLLATGAYGAVLPDVAVPRQDLKGLFRLPLDVLGLKPRHYHLVWSRRAAATRPAVARSVEFLGQALLF